MLLKHFLKGDEDFLGLVVNNPVPGHCYPSLHSAVTAYLIPLPPHWFPLNQPHPPTPQAAGAVLLKLESDHVIPLLCTFPWLLILSP